MFLPPRKQITLCVLSQNLTSHPVINCQAVSHHDVTMTVSCLYLTDGRDIMVVLVASGKTRLQTDLAVLGGIYQTRRLPGGLISVFDVQQHSFPSETIDARGDLEASRRRGPTDTCAWGVLFSHPSAARPGIRSWSQIFFAACQVVLQLKHKTDRRFGAASYRLRFAHPNPAAHVSFEDTALHERLAEACPPPNT